MNKIPQEQPVVAAFDFDNTITSKESFSRFLMYYAGIISFAFGIFFNIPLFFLYFAGAISRDSVKERIVSYFFKGEKEKKMRNAAEKYARKKLPKMVRKDALERIKWHLSQGHRCVLVSASLDLYLIPWAKEAGFQEVLSTRLEFKDGVATGKIFEKNCRGPEKVERLQNLLGILEENEIYAYGDSEGDREMLAIADHAFYRSFKN